MLSTKEARQQPQKAKEIKLGKSLFVIQEIKFKMPPTELMENTSTLHGSM